MNLAALSAVYPGYIKGQDALAQLAVDQEKAAAIKRDAAIESGLGNYLANGGTQPNAPPQGGLGGVAPPQGGGLAALGSGPPGPQGPGQPSVPMQQGAPGGAAPQAGPAPPQGGPPPGAPPPPQGGGMNSLQQMAQAIVQANPNVNFKTPEGARLLLGMVEKNQQLLAPQDKADLQAYKLTMELQQKAQQLELGYAKLDSQAQIQQMRNDMAMQLQKMKADGASQKAQQTFQQAVEMFIMKAAQQDKNTDKLEAGRNQRAGQKTEAQLGQLAARNGVSIPYGTPPEQAQGMIADAVAKKMSKGTIGDDDAEFIADVMKTDPTFISHATGNGAAGTENKKKVIAVLKARTEAGQMSPEDFAKAQVALTGAKQEARTIGSTAGSVALGTKEIDKIAPLVLAASKKVNRTQYPSVNKLIEAAQKGTGGTDVITLASYIQNLKNAYAQVLKRGGRPTDAANAQASELIDKAWSDGQIEAAIAAMRKEAAIAGSAASEAGQDAKGRVGGKPEASGAASDMAPAENDPFGIR